jgi:peptide deformylase
MANSLEVCSCSDTEPRGLADPAVPLPWRTGFRKSLSMIRPILIHPDPRLKKLCEPVGEITPDLRRLADDMLETMYDAPGIGLAAPQVGVTKRLIVMDCIKDGPPEPVILFNPEVRWKSEDLTVYEEGCLSIPDIYNDITRPAEVTVGWTDEHGLPQERQFAGLWATCVQHEIDHLDGRLFIDYLGPLKRQMITRKMEKLKRERARE